MNFSSHQEKIIKSIQLALSKDKSSLVLDFRWILSSAKKLYKTSAFDFWLLSIGSNNIDEIPVTKYGHNIAIIDSKRLSACNRNQVVSAICGICENLFTYCSDDDMCQMQGDYHYYFSISAGKVFKESEMGYIEGIPERPESGDYRIALISELDCTDAEYIS